MLREDVVRREKGVHNARERRKSGQIVRVQAGRGYSRLILSRDTGQKVTGVRNSGRRIGEQWTRKEGHLVDKKNTGKESSTRGG